MVIDLSTKYGLTEADWSRTLREAGVSLAQAQTKYPRYYSRWTTGEGLSAEKFLDNGVFTCAYLDAFWTGHEHDIKNPPAGSGNIFISAGKWQTNQQLYLTFGRVFGDGIFLDKRYDTCVSPRHNRWNGDIMKRNIFVSPTYGREDLLGYHEGASFDNIRLDGAKTSEWYDASYESSGLVGWDLGEGAELGRIKADKFNSYGVEFIRATPAALQYLSSFQNNLGAVGLTGTALGTINIITLSGDESPTLIDMREGHGRMAGGCLTVTAIKAETSTTPENLIGQWKGQLIAKLRGQFNVVFTNIQYGSPWITSGQLFWVDGRVMNNGVLVQQQSRLKVSGKGFGYGAVITDSGNKTYYTPPASYSGWELVYLPGEGPQGVLKINDVVQTPKAYPCDGPMGFARTGETLNYGTCTPMQKVGSTTPVPPVIPPTEPPIPPVEPPVTPTPPTGTLIASFLFNTGSPQSIVATTGTHMVQNDANKRVSSIGGGRVVNTNVNASYDVNWKAVRKLVLKGLKSRGTNDARYFCGGANFRGIVMLRDGSIVENFSGGDKVIAPAGTVTTTAKDVTLTLDTARDLSHWLAIPGAGNAALVEMDAMEIWT